MFTSLNTSDFLALIGGMPGWAEIAIVLVIGLLIFGKRLPDVGRNLGKSIIEFKKGIKGIGDDIESESDKHSINEIEHNAEDESPAKVTPNPTDESKDSS